MPNLTYFLIAAVILLFIDILLFALFKKIGANQILKPLKDSAGNKSQHFFTLIYLFILFGLCGYTYFFCDRSMQFECLKETRICTYSHSTEYDQTMRLVKTYDFSKITRAKVTKHSRRKGGSYYTVDLTERSGFSFKIPHDFSSHFEAQEEARKFNRFLSSGQKSYSYIDLPAEISPAKAFFILCLIFTFFILSSLMRSFLIGIRHSLNAPTEAHEKTDIDEEIRKDLKEDGLSDEEIEAFLKEMNEDAEHVSAPASFAMQNDDVIQRSRNI